MSLKTCKEQLLYEVHDPARYYQPDVVADFSGVRLDQVGPDRVAVSGGTGHARTDTLKVSIGYFDSYVGEGQFSYAGPGALARAKLALQIVEERLKLTAVATTELRLEIIGVDSVHRGPLVGSGPEPEEARIRVVGRTGSLKDAIRIGNEVETLWLNGPAGGGGAWKSARRGDRGRVHLVAPIRDQDQRGVRGDLTMKLRELAHARAGDKGNVSNISVIAHEPGDYAFLAEHVTAERVKAHFADIVHGRVERYELPGIGALNFVLHDALGGGVTRSLSLDPHGKSLSSSLLELEGAGQAGAEGLTLPRSIERGKASPCASNSFALDRRKSINKPPAGNKGAPPLVMRQPSATWSP